MIHVRFDLVLKESSRGHDRTGIVRADMSDVPVRGELVNLLGHPCRVVDRAWAVGDEGNYAFVRVVSTSLDELLAILDVGGRS